MEDVFNTDRPLLFSIAYRMLGSAFDADDVLQDAWLRYSGADPSTVRSPIAFATTIVTRLCLDRLKSARVKREEYVGEWLPEPVLTSEFAGPDTMLQRAESVTLATGRRRVTGTPESRRTMAERFARALSSGDASELTALLASDVGFWVDGGGKVTAILHPVTGREPVVDILTEIHRRAVRAGVMHAASASIESVNFEPAIVARLNGKVVSLFVLETDGDAISAIRVIRNPDKLARLSRHLSAH